MANAWSQDFFEEKIALPPVIILLLSTLSNRSIYFITNYILFNLNQESTNHLLAISLTRKNIVTILVKNKTIMAIACAPSGVGEPFSFIAKPVIVSKPKLPEYPAITKKNNANQNAPIMINGLTFLFI